MTKNRKRFRFCAYPFSPSTVASIRETDARWKKQWGHDERRTLTGCGYCFDGGNPVIGHFRNPRGASRKKKRERKNINATYSTYIYIYIHVRVHYMVAIIVLNGCSRIRTQLFQTCAEKMERKGEGAFSVSLFSVSSFFWKFVRRDGSFSLLIPLFPPPPFFPFIHPSH